jgi:hypothetical protein
MGQILKFRAFFAMQAQPSSLAAKRLRAKTRKASPKIPGLPLLGLSFTLCCVERRGAAATGQAEARVGKGGDRR